MNKQKELIDWIIEKTENMNLTYSTNIMEADQAGYNPDGSHIQSERIQLIAQQARNEINTYRTELHNMNLQADAKAVEIKCKRYLDNWDRYFYHMAKYDKTQDLQDFKIASQAYNAVDFDLSEIIEMLGLKSVKRSDSSTYPQIPGSQKTSPSPPIPQPVVNRPAPQIQPLQPQQVSNGRQCSKCGTPVIFINKYKRYYCNTCQQYD